MQLSKDEFAALSGLLDQGLDLPESARAAWLDGLSEPFPGAKELLSKMLAQMLADDADGNDAFLDTLPKIPADAAAAGTPVSGLQTGSRIGIYILMRELGQGGMATVWLARRTDELTQRPVALKLPYLHLQSAKFAERFARERDILANLTHPHIAHLYDAGISPEGQPFLAMEFVAGEPLTDYCVKQQLNLDQRLQLFLQVLAAVDYAHTQGVIHRDLKPSNILVREGGQVVLLDFGIAKLIVEGQGDQTELTILGGAALTPHYASPEQIKGETLGPATDVYSLGVLLYELLSGQRPYELTGSTRGALEQAILTVEPRRPSEVVTQRTRTGDTVPSKETPRSRLRGDLDTIVLKALKKSPTERYATAGEFAEDLQRYLRGDAVTARPDSLWYRITKRVRRNKSALLGAAVAVAAVAILLAVATVLWQTRTGFSISAHSEAEAVFAPPAHSIAVLPFVNMSGDATQDYFSDGISEELLNSLSRLKELQVAARTSSFAYRGQNVDIATIAKKLNVSAILEGSVRRSGETVRVTVQLINAASGFHIWSHTYDGNLSNILKVQNDVATSVAQELAIKLVGDEAAEIEVGDTKNPAAYDNYLRGMRLYEEADTNEAANRAALAAADEAISLDPGYAAAYTLRARVLFWISNLTSATLETHTAARKQAISAAERAVLLAPEYGEAHLALAMARMGSLDFVGAASEFDRALALAPGSAPVQWAYGSLAGYLGHFEQAITAERRAVSLDPQNFWSHINLASVFYDARRFGEAQAALRSAQALKPGSQLLSSLLASTFLGMGQIEQARKFCELSATPLNEDDRHSCLALAYHGLNRQSDAERELAQFQALDHDAAAYSYAQIYAQWGNTPAALEWLTKAERLGDPALQALMVDWMLDPIRNDPQFKAIEARLNFPPVTASDGLLPSDGNAPTEVASSGPAQPASVPTPIDPKSVAVLPFVDMSEKKDQEYFSDGLSEELIDMLARIPDLRVPARTSSFYFKGKQKTIADIARALRVANILEGSVRKSGDTLRITAQLIRADTGYHIWSETYERQFNDIFKIQDEIADAVVKALKISVLESALPRAAPTTSSEAYTLDAQARALLLHSNPADTARAAKYLERAVQLDPNYAPAWARLTLAHTSQFEMGTLSFEEARAEARHAAQRALDLDPNLAAAHLSMARVQRFFDRNWAVEDVEIQRARQLDPEDGDAVRWAGTHFLLLGHLAEAAELFQHAAAMDPLNGANYTMLGLANLALGKYAEADSAYRKAVELAPPRGFGADAGHAKVLLVTGRAAAAFAAFEQLENRGDREWGKALAYFALGRKADSDTAVMSLERNFAETRAYEIAQVHAFRGESELTFEWLEHAYQHHERALTLIKADAFMASLRENLRYKALLHKMNLPE